MAVTDGKQAPCNRCGGSGKEISAKNRNNRSRGSANERRLAKLLSNWWIRNGVKYDFLRTPQSGGSKLKDGFDMAGDITTNAPDWPFHVEAKREAAWDILQLITGVSGGRIMAYWKQASEDCPTGKTPFVIMSHPQGTQQFGILPKEQCEDLLVANRISYMMCSGLCIFALGFLLDVNPTVILSQIKVTNAASNSSKHPTDAATGPSAMGSDGATSSTSAGTGT